MNLINLVTWKLFGFFMLIGAIIGAYAILNEAHSLLPIGAVFFALAVIMALLRIYLIKSNKKA